MNGNNKNEIVNQWNELVTLRAKVQTELDNAEKVLSSIDEAIENLRPMYEALTASEPSVSAAQTVEDGYRMRALEDKVASMNEKVDAMNELLAAFLKASAKKNDSDSQKA